MVFFSNLFWGVSCCEYRAVTGEECLFAGRSLLIAGQSRQQLTTCAPNAVTLGCQT